jgi:hypothetical protein
MMLYKIPSNVNIRSSKGNSQSKSPLCKVPDFNRVASEGALAPESGIVYTQNDSEMKTQGTVQFLDGNPSFTTGVSSEIDSSRYEAHDPNVDIQNFFKRPVKITDIEWAVGGNVKTEFDPWELWFRNKRVGNRLSNYKLFSGNLHLQFVLNGNQFYWGRALAAYAPLKNSRTYFLTNEIDADNMRLSQKPHLWIDPCSSQGGHMECPFFWPANQFDLTVNNANTLGTVYMNSVVPLSHMNNQSRPINIVVYAWCENVVLSAPTQVNIASLVAQSGGDEYGQGVISKPAGVISQLAGKLKQVPTIGPYARATQMIANTVGSIASSFGYSLPRDLRVVNRVAMSQMGNFSTTDGEDDVQTLALTQKNEVTIDPRTTGLGDVDELAFSEWNKKESYLVTAPWSLAMTENSPIISIPVTPCIYRPAVYPLFSKTGWATAPTTIAAAPFGNWKGTMTYRFQVVSSGYHKGRLLVVWDPVTSNAVPETNTVYSRIVDIADTKDFEITVGWGASVPGLFTRSPTIATQTYSIGSLYNADTARHNGVLSVYVLNPLVTSGASTESVQLVVSTKSNDMKFWYPTSTAIKNLSFKQPPNDPVAKMVKESGIVEMSDDVKAENAAPEDAMSIEQVSSNPQADALATCTGDPCVSWRTLLKRKALCMVYPTEFQTLGTKYTKIVLRGSSAPIWRGYMLGAVHTDKNGVPFNASPTTVYDLVASCFIGWRGSMRYKMVQMVRSGEAVDGTNLNPLKPLCTIASRDHVDFYENTVSSYNADPVNAMYLATDGDESWSGIQVSTDNMDGTLSFEVPWYYHNRFIPVYSVNNGHGGWQVSRTFFPSTLANVQSQVDVYRSVGEDFNFFFFAGTPVFWNLPLTPDV